MITDIKWLDWEKQKFKETQVKRRVILSIRGVSQNLIASSTTWHTNPSRSSGSIYLPSWAPHPCFSLTSISSFCRTSWGFCSSQSLPSTVFHHVIWFNLLLLKEKEGGGERKKKKRERKEKRILRRSQLSLVAQLCPTLVWSYGLQNARLPCPSPSPRACSNSCASSWWCHPTSVILSSVIPFSSHLKSFTASGSFPMSQFFASDGQILEVQLQYQSFQWIFRTDFL